MSERSSPYSDDLEESLEGSMTNSLEEEETKESFEFHNHLKSLNTKDLEKLLKKDTILNYEPMCVRKKSNWAYTKNAHKFDHVDFSPNAVLQEMPLYSPKMVSLFQRIEKMDRRDKEKYGKHFKHFIFSDLKSSAKLLASAMIAHGFHLGYAPESIRYTSEGKSMYGKLALSSKEILEQTPGRNFYLLSSVGVYDKPITVAMKKQILRNFNERSEEGTPSGDANVHGKYARFIIMDSGFKEGIDLFDIKYIHIFEPQTTAADQKQVIGRGTRTCGQKGLVFHPRRGWPLYVTIYDMEIEEEFQPSFIGARSVFDLYLKSLKLDLRLFQFARALEETTIFGSVDYELNQNIHHFAMEEGENSLSGGGPPSNPNIRYVPVIRPLPPMPALKTGFEAVRENVRRNFSEFAWDVVKMENLCLSSGGATTSEATKSSGGALIHYTPTQDFIRHYFTPENPTKGMLLWQSVGTGKTCTAIATATTTFERQGYTILWVTRTTLKNDIWKNMFDQVCNESIRDGILANAYDPYPDEHAKRMRLLSPAWRIRPMSYKQFSNLVSKENQMYKTLVKINGEEDPLRKTLLIIDEAHKLYGGADLSSLERPDMEAFHKSVMHSYAHSGKDSVRLLLMTATPITQDPMELLKLLNLCKTPDAQFSTEFAPFSAEYLDDSGDFTARGRANYLDEIAGHVSYLNREKDARQFAQPVISYAKSDLIENVDVAKMYDKRFVREYLDSGIGELKNEIREKTDEITAKVGDLDKNRFRGLNRVCSKYDGKVKKKCEKVVGEHITALIRELKEHAKVLREGIKEIREKVKAQGLLKKEVLLKVAKNIKGEDPDKKTSPEYERFRQSAYFQLKLCGKTVKTNAEFESVIKMHPDIKEYDEQILGLDQEIENTNRKVEMIAQKWAARQKYLRNLLKYGDLRDLEKSVVRMNMKSESQEIRKMKRTAATDMKEEAEQIQKAKRTMLKTRRKRVTRLTKIFRNTLKEQREVEKELKQAEKELKKQRRVTNDLEEEEINDEYIRNLVKKHKEEIDADLEKIIHDLSSVERAKIQEKETKQREKAAAKEAAKETRKKETEAKKEVKRREKEALRATKKRKP
jgi:hypothetical protein